MLIDYIQERYNLEDFGLENWSDVALAYAESLRQGKYSVYSTDSGFFVFRVKGDSLEILDMYIDPKHRRNNHASQMADRVAELAKEQGARVMIGFSELGGKNAEMGQKAMKAYGLTPYLELTDQTVWIKGI